MANRMNHGAAASRQRVGERGGERITTIGEELREFRRRRPAGQRKPTSDEREAKRARAMKAKKRTTPKAARGRTALSRPFIVAKPRPRGPVPPALRHAAHQLVAAYPGELSRVALVRALEGRRAPGAPAGLPVTTGFGRGRSEREGDLRTAVDTLLDEGTLRLTAHDRLRRAG